MLTITPSAADAIRELVESNGLPAEGGLRLARATAGNGSGQAVELELAAEPGPADDVVDEGDAHVFIDPDLVPLVDDLRLEAAGDGERVGFALVGPQT